MNTNQNWFFTGDCSFDKCKVLNAVDGALVCNAREGAELSGNHCFTHALDKAFVVAAVFDELGNR